MPAAAVIPAPLAYTIIVAVKRLVVGLNNCLLLCYARVAQILTSITMSLRSESSLSHNISTHTHDN